MSHPRTLFLLLLLIGPTTLLVGCGGGGGGGGNSGGNPTTPATTEYAGIVVFNGQTGALVVNAAPGQQASGTLTVTTNAAAPAVQPHATTVTPGTYPVSGPVTSSGQYTLTGTLAGGAVTITGTLPTGTAAATVTLTIGGASYTSTISSTNSVTGKIVDQSGTPVPTAVVLVDNVQQNYQPASGNTSFLVGGASFNQGGYRLEGMAPGFHVITAQAANGYTGSTQVFVISGFATSNANIVVSPPSQQAIVTGKVVAGDTGQGLGGAQVYLRYPVSQSQTNPNGYASLVGYTFADGTFELDNVPVYTTATGTVKQTYTAGASLQSTANSKVYDDATLTNQAFNVSTANTPGTDNALPNLVLPLHNGGYATGSQFTPTITLAESFTQPNIPSIGPAAVSAARPSAAAQTSAYEQIHRLLSPAYARLSNAGHAAASVRRASAQPRATASDYVIEMDLFFSLPGDTTTAPDSPLRSQLYGFAVYNNINPTGDFLGDPLANFYDDPSLGTALFYSPDLTYKFQVASIASNGSETLGTSAIQQITPLEFVNLLHPADPNDTGTVETLASNTVQWNAISRAQSYTVLIYNTFPAVSTTPILQSTVTTTSYAIPANTLTAGQQYWVVVSAAATDNTTTSQAISVSQITPFMVH